MPNLLNLFGCFVLPALIVAAALVIPGVRWVVPIAISAGFAVAYSNIGGAPHWPPGSGDASYWLIWVTVPTGLLGLLFAVFKMPGWLRLVFLLVVSAAAAKALLAPLGAGAAGPVWIAVWAVAGTISAMSWERIAEKKPSPLFPTLVVLTLGASVVTLALSNNIKPSQGGVALTGMAIVALILVCVFRRISPVRGMGTAFIIPLLSVFLFVHLYSYTEPPPASTWLILVTPVVALIADLPGFRRGRLVLIFVPVVLLLAVAAGLSARQFLQSPADAAPSGQGAGDY